MDGDGWRSLVFGLLALLVLTGTAITQTYLGLTSNRRLRSLQQDSPAKRNRTIQKLADPRRAMFAAMAFLQVVAAIIATAQLIRFYEAIDAPGSSFWWGGLTVVIWFIICGAALPRALAERDLPEFGERVGRIVRLVTALLVPVTWTTDAIGRLWNRVLPGEVIEVPVAGLEDELDSRRLALDEDTISEDEREMIDGILSLEEMTARDIMVPRLDIIGVERTIAPAELIETITKAGHSRIPVYQQTIDNVLGVLYAKDLLRYVIGNTVRIPVLDLLRPAFVVPESKKLSELYRELKLSRIHIAIVADEYGGTAGLVTFEDILEEIVGEIQDEYDSESPLFEQVETDELVADGRLAIEEVEDALRIRFEDDDFGTLGGFVHKHLGRLPIQGDEFEAEGVHVEILTVERHRITAMRVTRLAPQLEQRESDDDSDATQDDE